jgi:hypothetical protein
MLGKGCGLFNFFSLDNCVGKNIVKVFFDASQIMKCFLYDASQIY